MALTEKYVTSSASGGDGSVGSPWTLAEAFANAAAGTIVYVKTGTYTIASSLSFTNTPTVAAPIILRGYDTVTNDGFMGRDANGFRMV